MENLAPLLPLLLILAFTYLFLLRPAQQRQKRAMAVQQALAVGDRVITTSGLHGTIRSLDQKTASLEIAKNTVITLERRAIMTIDQPQSSAAAQEN